MDVIGAFWHLVNLFAPAFGIALLAAAITRLMGTAPLRQGPFGRLWFWPALAMSVVTVAGLAWYGRDGRMGTYVAMLVACALALWGAGLARR